MSLHFISSGLQTSIQDLGRSGQMHNGIAHSGAMDPVSMQMANWLVSKPLDAAVIEVTLIGPKICFGSAMTIAVCGAEFELFHNGDLVFNDRTIKVSAGDILAFEKLQSGSRAYLGVSADIKIPRVLASYSTHLTANFGGYLGRQFKNGDLLATSTAKINKNPELRQIPPSCHRYYYGNYLLRCLPAIESDIFSNSLKKDFFSQAYKVSADSNRMGIRLTGKPLEFKRSMEITSSGLTQGSIQIPPSGQAIISSVDGQTIGGYPRIANIISADLAVLGQLKAHDKVSFSLITKTRALDILKQQDSLLKSLFNQ